MPAEPTPMLLDAFEVRLVTTLRNMPDSPLKERVHALLERVMEFARNPRCPELQADGVPCERAEADCDQCRIVTRAWSDIASRFPCL